jgi:radical SAM protein with 4Fe4S-binding SPASM domain
LKSYKNKLLSDSNLNPALYDHLANLCENKKRPLGRLNTWAWFVEITRGCNLKCAFCPTRLFPKDEIHFMEKDTWVALLQTIKKLTPHGRLELCNAGEPTLHPNFVEYISIAREICPNLQILTYTNGTQLTNGNLTYRELFAAGLNMVFVDMYAPFNEHRKLAESSGHYWYHQDHKPNGAPSVFTNHGNPDIHIIMLAENPYNWTKAKLGRGYLQTYLNDLDWKAAKKFGLEPVVNPPKRRCDIPNKFISVNYDGTFIFCCFDYMRHTTNKFGNIKDGIDGFFKFWLSKYMQDTRMRLYNKDRKSHEYCSKCSFTSIRCDIPYWGKNIKSDEEMVALASQYWNGESWESTDES